MKKLIILIFTITLPIILFCQVNFEKTFGGPNDEYSHSVLQTDDNGFILCGFTSSYGNGGEDIYVVKTDEFGNLEWDKTYGGEGDDHGYLIIKTNDGNYMICGETTSFGIRKAYVLKINSIGDTLWTNVYEGYYLSRARYILETNENEYVICGGTSNTNIGETDVYLFKIDQSGQLLWSKTYGGTGYDNAYAMCQTSEGGFLLCGSTNSFGVENFDIYIISVNSDGDTIWTKTYGGPASDAGHSVKKVDESSYLIGGDSPNFGTNNHDMVVFKIDSAGEIIWSSTIGSDNYEFGGFISLTTDGNIVGCGWTHNPSISNSDILIFKMDYEGDTIWTNTFGGNSYEVGYGIFETSDLGYVITGYTQSYGAGNSDMYLIKTNSEGILTSINDQNIKSDPIKIYPNPCSYKFYLNKIGKISQVELIGINGNRYRPSNISNNNQELLQFDVSDIPKGVYIMRLKYSNSYYYKKLIIN